MKKLVSITLAVVMVVCALSAISAFADEPSGVVFVSRDDLFCSGTQDPATGIWTADPSREYVKFYGWIACSKEIDCFFTRIDGGYAIYDTFESDSSDDLADGFFTTADDVKEGGELQLLNNSIPHDPDAFVPQLVTRIYPWAPLQDGTHLYEAFVEFADGTSELIWDATITRGAATEVPEYGAGTTTAGDTTTVAEDTTTVAEDTTTVAEDTTTVAEDTTTVAEDTTTVAEDTTTAANDEIVYGPLKTDVTNNKAAWENICVVSYDEIGPLGNVNGDETMMKAPVVGADEEEIRLWGWITAAKDIAGFSYSINGGTKTTSADFKVEAEDAVYGAGGNATSNDNKPVSANGVSRFNVTVPLSAGSQLVQAYVDYTDGTSEVFWALVATRGEKTELSDDILYEIVSGGTTGDDTTTGGTTGGATNPSTGDIAVIVFAAVAVFALAGAVVCKKIKA